MVGERDSVPDHYRVLGVAPDASEADIRLAYRRAARRCHPDTNPDLAVSAHMVAVNEAGEVLCNPTRRAAYDRRRLAAGPPRPRLEPATVDFGTLGPNRAGHPVSIRVINDGGEPATVRIEPESGPFWALTGVRGPTGPGEVAILDLTPRPEGVPAGSVRSCLRVCLDDRSADLHLCALSVQSPDRHCQAAGAGFVCPPAPRRRRPRPGRAVLAAAVLAAAVLLAWPGAPGASLLSKLAGELTASHSPYPPAGAPGASHQGPASNYAPALPAPPGGRGQDPSPSRPGGSGQPPSRGPRAPLAGAGGL